MNTVTRAHGPDDRGNDHSFGRLGDMVACLERILTERPHVAGHRSATTGTPPASAMRIPVLQAMVADGPPSIQAATPWRS